MKCAQIREWLPELAGGELGPRERAACEAHLRDCAPCQDRLAGLREAVSLLRDAGARAEAPAGFGASLHRRLAAEPPPRPPLGARILALFEPLRLDSWRRLGALAGAAAAALVLVVVLPGLRGPAPGGAGGGEVAAPFQVPSRRVAVVHLDFVTDAVVDNVEFEVTLPAELAFISDGKPLRDRTLHWSGSLAAGSNPIPLAVSGTKPGRYKIVARARGAGVDVAHDVLLEVVPS
jgi:anti-sigma factor RsiW